MSAMMTLQQAAKALDAVINSAGDVTFSGVSTDTRTLQSGDLFVALQGPNFDANTLLAQARDKGAVAAVVGRAVDDALPQLQVADTRLALGQLAADWRRQFQGKVVAVTGSNGKTTVKEMLAAILAQRGEVLATAGNLNNDIGMPLTLLRLRKEHRYAVIEMGANHVGEIAYLTSLARPDVAVVNNVAGAHTEGFGSLENIAKAKAEIWQGLADDGVAVVNVDDGFASDWLTLLADRLKLTFGTGADVSLLSQDGFVWNGERFANAFSLNTPVGQLDVQLPLAGQHNVANAMAATAAAIALDVPLTAIKAGLEQMVPVKGRLQPKTSAYGQLLLDDSYNANPTSVRAAIEVLATLAGETILVLGDMAELGAEAEALHRELGGFAKAQKIDALYGVGQMSRHTVDGFGQGAHWFETQAQLNGALSQYLADGHQATLLVKGSRSAAMDKVVDALQSTVTVGEGA